MVKTAVKPKVINVLGKNIDEKMLQASFRDVLKKRGITAQLVVKDGAQLKKMKERQSSLGNEYSDYGNIYKYAFF